MKKEEEKPKVRETPKGVVVKKYKPVTKKVKPVITQTPSEFCIEQKILGNSLESLLTLPTNPPEFVPRGRYTDNGRQS